MVYKNRTIYGFLGPSWILITYNLCPPVNSQYASLVMTSAWRFFNYLCLGCFGVPSRKIGSSEIATRPPLAARARPCHGQSLLAGRALSLSCTWLVLERPANSSLTKIFLPFARGMGEIVPCCCGDPDGPTTLPLLLLLRCYFTRPTLILGPMLSLNLAG